MVLLLVVVVVELPGAGCGESPQAAVAQTDSSHSAGTSRVVGVKRSASGRGGSFLLAWRSDGIGRIPLEVVEVEVEVEVVVVVVVVRTIPAGKEGVRLQWCGRRGDVRREGELPML
ncbi:hypothetical protein E2C01_055319 [Portunus trituberculatus]|uniref:Secreted protein n=1 Tax=Portunus trituberculatus TaxID=210409 RepID=A0A5B7GME7_PORTR|nr:hypothetical protein [Portunus trituberculatus]